MRLSLFAVDIGPARNLAMIAAAAIHKAHRAFFLGNDELMGRTPLVPLPDVLVTGLSSFKNSDELDLGYEAGHAAIPWIVLADTHGSWGREAARGKVGNAILLIASPAEIEAAKAFGYSRVEFLGGPPLWQEYPTMKPAAIVRRHPANKVILVGGIKDAALTDRLLGLVVKTANNLLGRGWELIFKPHPNEDESSRDSRRREEVLAGVYLLETPARTTNLLKAVDLSFWTSGATDTIAAAYQRTPAIYYEDDDIRARVTKLVGQPRWFPAESGACAKSSPENFAEVFQQLLTENGRTLLATRQAEVYPLSPQGELIENQILTFIASAIGNK